MKSLVWLISDFFDGGIIFSTSSYNHTMTPEMAIVMGLGAVAIAISFISQIK